MNLRLNQTEIKSFSYQQLVDWLTMHRMEPYRAGQILRWIYQKQAESFDVMTDLARDRRELLSAYFSINRLEIVKTLVASDGTKKFLFQCADNTRIETVLIPERDRFTLCVSSQAGCAMGCKFCCTANMGLTRNLEAYEIISQVRDVQAKMENPYKLTNIVFMGMGEPLANYENVRQAIDVITDRDRGLCFSGRRVTVSTAGLIPNMASLGRDTRANLAISLNAADNKTRDSIMPINKRYPIEILMDACKNFPLRGGRRITFEYVLIKGVNDSPESARDLSKLLTNLPAKINLIPYNPHKNSPFARPEDQTIARFQQILLDKNYTTIIRNSKGGDIAAACGQLTGEYL